jgi:hypothetical protein
MHHTLAVAARAALLLGKQPFYTAVPWAGKHYTCSHLPHLYDMLRASASHRAASFTDTWNKRRSIQSTQSFVWMEWVISRSKQGYQRSNSSGGSLCITAAMHCPAMHPAGKDYQPQVRLHSRQQHFAHVRCGSGTHAVSPPYWWHRGTHRVSPLYWWHRGTRLITAQQSLLWSTIATAGPVF